MEGPLSTSGRGIALLAVLSGVLLGTGYTFYSIRDSPDAALWTGVGVMGAALALAVGFRRERSAGGLSRGQSVLWSMMGAVLALALVLLPAYPQYMSEPGYWVGLVLGAGIERGLVTALVVILIGFGIKAWRRAGSTSLTA